MKTKLLILLLLPFFSFSQIAMSIDPVGGIPLTGGPNPNIKGSPYLLEDWSKGDIILRNGENWKNWDIKVDLYSKIVIYKDLEGQLKKVVKPISAINFNNNGILSLVFLNNDIYQVIAPGNLSLLKRIHKTVTESKDYTSSSTTKNYATSSDYFVLKPDGQIVKTKLSKGAIQSALPELSNDIAAYAKEHTLKKEDDYVGLFEFINQKTL